MTTWTSAPLPSTGHHDPAFSLRTYTNLMGSREERARAAIDHILGTVQDCPDITQGVDLR
jgi:hypothetical protein